VKAPAPPVLPGATTVSRPRSPGDPCTTRNGGRPRAAASPGCTGAQAPRGLVQRPGRRRRLRLFDFEVFFFGTAIVILSTRVWLEEQRARTRRPTSGPSSPRSYSSRDCDSRRTPGTARGNRAHTRARAAAPRYRHRGPGVRVEPVGRHGVAQLGIRVVRIQLPDLGDEASRGPAPGTAGRLPPSRRDGAAHDHAAETDSTSTSTRPRSPGGRGSRSPRAPR